MSATAALPITSPNDTTPADLGAAGARFWAQVMEHFDPEEHERILLLQTCRVLDIVTALDDAVIADGPVLTTDRGPKPHPAAVEARQQRLVLARLISSLRLPDQWVAGPTMPASPSSRLGRPQRRGAVRGVYAVGGRERSGPL